MSKLNGSLLLSMFAIVALGSIGLLFAMSDSPSVVAAPQQTAPESPAAVTGATVSSARPAIPAASPIAPRASTPAPRPTAAAREHGLVTKLRTSGVALGRWTDDARRVISTWRAAGGDVAAKAQFAELECFRDGCIGEATYPDELAFELADQSLTDSEAFKSFPGWRHRSFRKTDAGQVVATWFFMNPASAP